MVEVINGIGLEEKEILIILEEWLRDGFEKVMKENKFDVIVIFRLGFLIVFVIGGYLGIGVFVGYDNEGVLFGICFGGLRGIEF